MNHASLDARQAAKTSSGGRSGAADALRHRLRWLLVFAALLLPIQPTRAAPLAEPIAPRLFVLAIGVGDYKRADLYLRFPGKDARDLAEVLRQQARRLYRAVDARVLTDKGARKGDILDGLDWLQRETTSHDLAVIFLAGHGINDPTGGGYYFLPHDADVDAVRRTMLASADLRAALDRIAGKVLLFLDTCHAGGVIPGTHSRDVPDVSLFIRELVRADNGVVVFTAATGRQVSLEGAGWKNGAFTKALVEGLRGRADLRRSGRVTVSMLDLYVSERVKQLTGGVQTPASAKPGALADFPIATAQEWGSDDLLYTPARTLPTPLQRRWWFWVALGAGLAAVTTAAVLGGMAAQGHDPLLDVPPGNRWVLERP